MTEPEFLDMINDMEDSEILSWCKRQGLEFEPVLSNPQYGVYRRENGMDLIEFDGDTWIAFNPIIVGTDIVWSIVGKDWWVQVLSAGYSPVVDGCRVQFSKDGRRVG